METYNLLVYIISYIGLFTASFYILSLLAYYRKEKEAKALPAVLYSVSIVIPAYNEEKSIARTIESALGLDYPKGRLEIIVVDDGSRDKTYKEALKFVKKGVKVYHKVNGGKGSALNFGISRARGEIVITMDADTFVEKDCLKLLMPYFSEKKVMSVTPSMSVYKPRSFWQRIQHIEYAIGVYLRKAFASVNVMHVTPGAFSAYRKSFFTRYGGFDEHNLTEDTEIALRIQHNNFAIENEPRAVIHTIAPRSFNELLVQRRRWYTGLVKNLWSYRSLFGFKRGLLGSFSLPLAVLTIFSSIFLTGYLFVKTFNSLRKELIFLESINFQFFNLLDINRYIFRYVTYALFSHAIFLFTILFVLIVAAYLLFARKHLTKHDRFAFNFFPFILFYGILFAFWWSVAFIYILFNRKVVWRNVKHVD